MATEEGQRRLCELDTLLRQVEDHVLSSLDTADREALRGLVQRVALDLTAGRPAEQRARSPPTSGSTPGSGDCQPLSGLR